MSKILALPRQPFDIPEGNEMSSMKLRVLVTLLLVAVLTKLGSTQGLPDVEQKNKNQTGLFAFGGVWRTPVLAHFGEQGFIETLGN